MQKNFWIIGAIVIGAVVLGIILSQVNRNAEPVGEVSGEVTVGTAVVDRVQVNVMESWPLQASATISGNLPDGCTTLGDVSQALEGMTLRVTVATERPTDQMCTQALVPYTENIMLDILGLPAGEYAVEVNGVSARLTLEQDNQVDYDSDKGLVPGSSE